MFWSIAWLRSEEEELMEDLKLDILSLPLKACWNSRSFDRLYYEMFQFNQ